MAGRFRARKAAILKLLDAPDEAYHDLSPKGSIDEPIRFLIEEINRLEGLVTTSSCSGRMSVFLEGRKRGLNGEETDKASPAGPGGKGGGTWLYISHDPAPDLEDTSKSSFASQFGLLETNGDSDEVPALDCRYIHLKFEPMVRCLGAPMNRN